MSSPTAVDPSDIAIDTSIAVPLLIANHPDNEHLRAWASTRRLRLSGHAAIETYAVITRLPGEMRVAATDAIRLLEANFAEPLMLSATATARASSELALRGVCGGATYDGLVALAAKEAGLVLATRDTRALSTYDALHAATEVVPSLTAEVVPSLTAEVVPSLTAEVVPSLTAE